MHDKLDILARQNSLESSLRRLGYCSSLLFPVWSRSSKGEITCESGGFRLVGDGIATSFQLCGATSKLLTQMWVFGGCASCLSEDLIRLFALQWCLHAPGLEGQRGSRCCCWGGGGVSLIRLATGVSVVEFFPSWLQLRQS